MISRYRVRRLVGLGARTVDGVARRGGRRTVRRAPARASSRRRSGSTTSSPASPINILALGVARFMSTTLFVGEQGGFAHRTRRVLLATSASSTMPVALRGAAVRYRHAGRSRSHRRVELVRRVRRRRRAQGPHRRRSATTCSSASACSRPACSCCGTHVSGCASARRASIRAPADSLGVRVHLLPLHRRGDLRVARRARWAMLVIAAGRYSQSQTVGKGFLGLATLVVGNWQAGRRGHRRRAIFGFFDGITQRLSPEDLVLALLLAAALLLFAGTVYVLVTKGRRRPEARSPSPFSGSVCSSSCGRSSTSSKAASP